MKIRAQKNNNKIFKDIEKACTGTKGESFMVKAQTCREKRET